MSGFAEELAVKIEERREALEQWTAQAGGRWRPPFTSSVDLRDSGFKIVPIDTNVFPGGFNNLCNGDLELAGRSFAHAIRERAGEGVRSVGIVAEPHTANLPYFSNLHSLQRILEGAGFRVEVISFAQDLARQTTEIAVGEERLHLHRGLRVADKVGSADLVPDLLLLNSDLTDGVPAELEGIGQPLFPRTDLGWWRRRKSTYFAAYDRLAGELAGILGIDPWRISSFSELVGGVDFDEGKGLGEVAEAVERVRARTAAKYAEYDLAEAPYAVVKSNNGTYGMGVLPVESGRQILDLSRKERKRLSRGKGGVPVREVIVQEGTPTIELRDEKVSEPVFYLVGGQIVGGFFRVHPGKGPRENLNSRGAEFHQICYHKHAGTDAAGSGESWRLSRAQAEGYALLARLASLAVGGEAPVEAPAAQRPQSLPGRL